jgi:energy-coupling factor transport system permease protein
MKSRGYGLPGRTAFSIYRFDRRDRAVLSFILACGAYVVIGAALGGLYFRYFPAINGKINGSVFFPVSLYAVYFALCVSPLIISFWEERKSIGSKI